MDALISQAAQQQYEQLNSNKQGSLQAQDQKKKMRFQPTELVLKCPRCGSMKTKFCYYNNYSHSQPRYFCKACKRYWTHGGSLRNVPVGGGSRKSKKPFSYSRRPEQPTVAAFTTTLTTNSTPPPILPFLTNDPTLAIYDHFPNQTTGLYGLEAFQNSILGDPITTHGDILGAFNALNANTNVNASFTNIPDVVGNPFSYGVVSEICGVGEISGGVTTTMATITTTKPESCKGGEMEDKGFGGIQWPFRGDGNLVKNEFGKEHWHGPGMSWPGILDGPLV